MEITLFPGVNKIGDWIVGPLDDNISKELEKWRFSIQLYQIFVA
jgi:hypothetical protein